MEMATSARFELPTVGAISSNDMSGQKNLYGSEKQRKR